MKLSHEKLTHLFRKCEFFMWVAYGKCITIFLLQWWRHKIPSFSYMFFKIWFHLFVPQMEGPLLLARYAAVFLSQTCCVLAQSKCLWYLWIALCFLKLHSVDVYMIMPTLIRMSIPGPYWHLFYSPAETRAWISWPVTCGIATTRPADAHWVNWWNIADNHALHVKNNFRYMNSVTVRWFLCPLALLSYLQHSLPEPPDCHDLLNYVFLLISKS